MTLEILQAVNLTQFWHDFQVAIVSALTLAATHLIQWLRNKGWKSGLSGDISKVLESITAIETKQTVMEGAIASMRHEFEINGGGTIKAALFDLRDTQAAYASLQLNASQEPVANCDTAGNWTFVNEAAEVLFGMSYSELIRKGWLSALPNVRERLEVMADFEECRAKDIPFRKEVHVKNADTGKVYFCELRAVTMRGKRLKGMAVGPVLFYHIKIKVLHTLEGPDALRV